MFHRETICILVPSPLPSQHFPKKLPVRAIVQDNRLNTGLPQGLLNFTKFRPNGCEPLLLKIKLFLMLPEWSQREKKDRNHGKHLVARRWQFSATSTLPYTSMTPNQGGTYRSQLHQLLWRSKTPIQFHEGVDIKEVPNLRVKTRVQLWTCEVEGLSNKEPGMSRGNRWNEEVVTHGKHQGFQEQGKQGKSGCWWGKLFSVSWFHFHHLRHPHLSCALIYLLRTSSSAQSLTL